MIYSGTGGTVSTVAINVAKLAQLHKSKLASGRANCALQNVERIGFHDFENKASLLVGEPALASGIKRVEHAFERVGTPQNVITALQTTISKFTNIEFFRVTFFPDQAKARAIVD